MDVDHQHVSAVLIEMHRRGESVCITPQNLIEFRNVATRPLAVNGFGMTASAADQLGSDFERTFQLLPDIPAIFPAWRDIVAKGSVIGKQVHDARLVAVCHVHQIENMLTFNVGHFTRLATLVPRLTILDPLSFFPPSTKSP